MKRIRTKVKVATGGRRPTTAPHSSINKDRLESANTTIKAPNLLAFVMNYLWCIYLGISLAIFGPTPTTPGWWVIVVGTSLFVNVSHVIQRNNGANGSKEDEV